MRTTRVQIKRVYEPALPEDGCRILVDRLWPRGLSKDSAHIDRWLREIGPSTELRRWFDHDPSRWKTFCTRYRVELRERGELLDVIREQAKAGRVTLVYAARDEVFNQAVVLQQVLKQSTTRKRKTR